VVFRINFAALFLAYCVASWYFTWEAAAAPDVRLINTLPPMAPMLGPLLLGLIVFLRTREIMLAAAICWTLAAVPILLYLALHPEELTSPRGLDIVTTLVPTVLAILMIIPFHGGLSEKVGGLQRERSAFKRQSEQDALTDLYNRHAGEQRLRELLTKRGGVILFDLDHFKRINDTHGHACGDEVLRAVADRCRGRLRQRDVCIRWGGEEFLALISEVDQEELRQISEELRRSISAEAVATAGHVTASFGITERRTGDTAESILARADKALYAAKAAGRNRVEIA